MVVRGKEHLRDLKKENSANPLVKHTQIHHPNSSKKVKFDFCMKSKYFDALSRQANEGVRIKNAGKMVMNSKSEFNHPPNNRVTVKRRY